MKNAIIKIKRPPGCNKTNLSIDALDSRTRELAWDTRVYVFTGPLLCRSLKLTEKGTLILEVQPECFEFLNDSEQKAVNDPNST